MGDDFYRRLDEATRIGPGVRKILETPLVYGDCASLAERPEQTAHTPLPWELHRGFSDWNLPCQHDIFRGEVLIAGVPSITPAALGASSRDRQYAGNQWKNAQFIVTACNNYEALKLSHEACVEQLQSIFQQVTNGRVCYFGDHTGYEPQFSTTQTCQWEEALANAKALTERL